MVTIAVDDEHSHSGLDGADIIVIIVASLVFVVVCVLGIVAWNQTTHHDPIAYKPLYSSDKDRRRAETGGYPVMNGMYNTGGEMRQRSQTSA